MWLKNHTLAQTATHCHPYPPTQPTASRPSVPPPCPQVAYRRGGSTALGLEIPLEAATNAGEVETYKQRELKRQKLREEGGGATADASPKVGLRGWVRRAGGPGAAADREGWGERGVNGVGG